MAGPDDRSNSRSTRRQSLRALTLSIIAAGSAGESVQAQPTMPSMLDATFNSLKEGFAAAGHKVIRTAGFSAWGVGEASYVVRENLSAAYVVRNPRSSLVSSEGLVFVLSESAPVVTMFGADPSGQSDSYEAFRAAIEFCNMSGSTLRIPAGQFLLERKGGRPGFDVECDIVGDGPRNSKIISKGPCPAGPMLRLGAYRKLANLALFREGPNEGLTGVSLRAAEQATFTGHIVVERIWIEGFGTNILLSNCYQWVIRDCIIQYGRFGIRFDTTDYATSTDSGYFAEGTIENCFINGNDRGVELESRLKSTGLRVTSTAIQASRGKKSQAFFRNIRPLSLDNCYFEARPDVAAIEMAECDASVANSAFIGTGGIDIGSAWGSLVVRRSFGTLSSDGIRAIGGTGQSVSVQDSEFVGPVQIAGRNQIILRSKVGKSPTKR